jgi:hypothetical protein
MVHNCICLTAFKYVDRVLTELYATPVKYCHQVVEGGRNYTTQVALPNIHTTLCKQNYSLDFRQIKCSNNELSTGHSEKRVTVSIPGFQDFAYFVSN